MNDLKIVPSEECSKNLWASFEKIYENSFDEGETDPIEVYRKAIEKGESRLFYLLFHGKLIGFYIIDVHKTFDMLNHIAVIPSFRNRGFGIKMVEHLKNRARREGKFLVVEADDQTAPFYEKLGFQKLDVEYFVPSFSSEKEVLPYNLLVWDIERGSSFTAEEIKELVRNVFKVSYYLDESHPLVERVVKSVAEGKKV